MKLPLLKRPDPSATGETAAVKKKRPALKKLGRKKLIALVAAAALVIGLGGHALLGSSAQAAKKSDGGYTTAQVTRRDVTATITGSGTLEAADSYNVTTLLEDTILTANFEEGDQVEEGTCCTPWTPPTPTAPWSSRRSPSSRPSAATAASWRTRPT